MNAATDQIPLLSTGDVFSVVNRLAGFETGVVVDEDSTHEYWSGSTRGLTCINSFWDFDVLTLDYKHIQKVKLTTQRPTIHQYRPKPAACFGHPKSSFSEILKFYVGCIVHALKDESNGETTRPFPAEQFIGKRAIEYPQQIINQAVEARTQETSATWGENEVMVWDQRRVQVLAAARAYGEETDANY